MLEWWFFWFTIVENTLCTHKKWQKISTPTLYLIFFKYFFFDKNLVQTSVRMYIVWWCMQVRNIFGLNDIFTAITGNDLNAFCANVYVYMHSDLSVVCKCANTQKIMYLSLHCWCVCRYINLYKISKTCTCVQDTLLHKLLCELVHVDMLDIMWICQHSADVKYV